jgi:hypothetical protein
MPFSYSDLGRITKTTPILQKFCRIGHQFAKKSMNILLLIFAIKVVWFFRKLGTITPRGRGQLSFYILRILEIFAFANFEFCVCETMNVTEVRQVIGSDWLLSGDRGELEAARRNGHPCGAGEEPRARGQEEGRSHATGARTAQVRQVARKFHQNVPILLVGPIKRLSWFVITWIGRTWLVKCSYLGILKFQPTNYHNCFA